MTEMDVTIKGYRAWVEYIKGQPILEPWHKEPQLVVWVGIDSPHATAGFGISLPLKEYSPDELKKLIEEEGARQFDKIIAQHAADAQKMEEHTAQKREADEVARKVAEAAGLEFLENKR